LLKLHNTITNLYSLFFIAIFIASLISFSSIFENLYAQSTTATNRPDFREIIDPISPVSQEKISVNEAKSQTETIQSKKIPNQYIVIFKNTVKDVGSLTEKLSTEIQANSLTPDDVSSIKVLDTFEKSMKGAVVKTSDVYSLLDIVHDPNVLYVEQDQKVFAFAQQIPKGINRVDADLSYTRSGNGAGTVNADIAIIDTGIAYNHPDLNIYKRVDFIGGTSLANDQNGHGSHVAGIAAAKDNSVGVVGVAPGARLWNLKVLDSTGAGTVSTLIKALDYVTANAKRIEVTNISLGCSCSSQALNTAISNAVKAGVTIVSAAGNQAKNVASVSPPNHPSVIAVSAITDTDGKCGAKGTKSSYGSDDTFASFSNYGLAIDVAAPGVSIVSTYKSNSYGTLTGTSMASPHVAGAVALYKSSHPSATPTDIINAIKQLGTKSSTICDNNGKGYFTGDKDTYREPLLYVRNY
jgi:subtilisin family serine protease